MDSDLRKVIELSLLESRKGQEVGFEMGKMNCDFDSNQLDLGRLRNI
jgi:hypothetical protein